MPLTLQQAEAQVRAKETARFRSWSAETARFRSWSAEAVRSRGVSFSGMGPGAYQPKTDAEITAEARALVRRRAEFEASPAGRFLRAAQQIEAETGDDRLVACWSRGLENVAAPLKVLDGMTGPAADACRAALADLAVAA